MGDGVIGLTGTGSPDAVLPAARDPGDDDSRFRLPCLDSGETGGDADDAAVSGSDGERSGPPGLSGVPVPGGNGEGASARCLLLASTALNDTAS